LAKDSDPEIEDIMIRHAQKIDDTNFGLQNRMINAFESLGLNHQIQEKKLIEKIFKTYLDHIEKDNSEYMVENESKRTIISKTKKDLRESILKVAAILDLDLEKETLEFLENLVYPYDDLYQLANKYHNNDKFKSIILKKLETSENPHFIKDLLRAILALKNNIKNWKQLIAENINKYQIIDPDLIDDVQEADLYDEDMLINFLNRRDNWHLEFIREFLLSNPDKLDEWEKFRNEFIKILKFFKAPDESWISYPNQKKKKKFALKILIDLEKRDMIHYCLENFMNLQDKELREICLFIIIKFGSKEILAKLKKYLDTDKESAEFFRIFWRKLENRDMQFYY
jgi:hypothetical protein